MDKLRIIRTNEELWALLVAAGGTVGLLVWVQHNGFFWDNILLASRYGQWYYDRGLKTVFVPREIAVGYPTLFGLGLAGWWKITQKSLETSHWLMLPALLGIVWQVVRLGCRFAPVGQLGAAVALILLDPTLLGQAALVGPEVVLVWLYLTALNAVLDGWRGLLALCLVGLTLLSLRGTIAGGALLATEVLLWVGLPKAERGLPQWRKLWAYLPWLIATALWIGVHYSHYGWVIYRHTGPWAVGSARVGLAGMLRNVGLIGWRLLDMGRVALWLTGAWLAWRLWRQRQWTGASWQLTVAVAAPLLVISAVLVGYANPIGHRYYLVVYLLVALWVAHHLSHVPPANRQLAYGLCLLALLSGHFWVYPDGIAKGWDASLAHLPYFGLRRQMLVELAARGIPVAAVGSDYPNAYPLRYPDLNGDERQFAAKDLSQNAYVLQSNVMNGFSDEEQSTLQTRWRLLRELRSGQVYFRLYQRPGE